jgi:heterotetrameric sarcosine oxidase beta subunit
MKSSYDAVIIGGGVQGLSLAYHLARKGFGKVGVMEKSYLGSGASGRNGEMLRSAFASAAWIRFFDKSLKMWETLAAELNFNVMYTRCGYLVLASTPEEMARCAANVKIQRSFGLATELLSAHDVNKLIPAINPGMAMGGILQKDGGFARHDAVVWAFAQAAARLKVDIFPYTGVTAIETEKGTVKSITTSRGRVSTPVVVNAAGGHARDVATMAGVTLPSKTYRLEMIVTEPLKPFLKPMVASLNTLSYMHQTTRGEFVGGAEIENLAPAATLKSSLTATQDMARKFVGLFPGLGGARLMRQWGGIVDMAPDIAPLLGPVKEIDGFILDCGWVYGFLGAPAGGSLLADYILSGEMPPEIAPFHVERFERGCPIIDNSLVVPCKRSQGTASALFPGI